MLQKLFYQFKQFSRENWWIYLLLIIALSIVLYTGKGNIYEVIFILLVNILGNLSVLLMQNAYKDAKFKTGAYFLLLGNIFYFSIALYSAIFSNEYQYLSWQIGFQLSGIKVYFLYIWNKEIKFINQYTLFLVSFMTLLFVVFFLSLSLYQILQSIGFSCVIIGLGMVDDIKRFFTIFSGNILITTGSYIGLYINFLSGDIFGVTISFAILGTSTFLFYLKLFPLYISRLKKL